LLASKLPKRGGHAIYGDEKFKLKKGLCHVQMALNTYQRRPPNRGDVGLNMSIAERLDV
jgi:hypothetical protein